MAVDDIDTLEEELEALEGGDDRRQQIMRFLPIILAVGALVVFAIVVLIAYSGGDDEQVAVAPAPTLAPEQTVKIEPENPGGMEIPDQDKLVYNQMNQGTGDEKVENLLPPPETPQTPPAAEAPPPPPPPQPETDVALPTVPQTPAPEAPPGTPKPGTAPAVAPKPSDAAPAAPATPGTDVAAVVPPAVPDQPQMPAPPPGRATTQTPSGGILQQPGKPPASGSAIATTSQMRTMAGVYRVQVASLKTQNQAELAWKEQVARYPDLLSQLSLTVQRAVLADKGTFYRVQAGPFQSRDSADSLCRKLKARGQDCIVVRP